MPTSRYAVLRSPLVPINHCDAAVGKHCGKILEPNCNVFGADDFWASRQSVQAGEDQPKGQRVMRIVLSDFLGPDGVIPAPGGRNGDTDGGFPRGCWSMHYFDPETMGPAVTET